MKKLSGLDRDCFIIPVHSLDRFLPSGVPMPVGIKFSCVTLTLPFACVITASVIFMSLKIINLIFFYFILCVLMSSVCQ